jgi:hypothetical protein
MLRPAAIALVAFAFAMMPGLRPADAATIDSDLYQAQRCVGCTSLIYDIVDPDTDRAANTEASDDLTSCLDYGQLYCGIFGDAISTEAKAELLTSIDGQLRSKISDLEILIRYRNETEENRGCSYFETKLRDPNRVREECDEIEPVADDLETVGVLTIVTVSMASFAVLASAWLLRRSLRNRQLRNIILRDKTTPAPRAS